MDQNTIIVGEVSEAKTTTFQSAQVDYEQLKKSYRNFKVDDLGELPIKVIGRLTQAK